MRRTFSAIILAILLTSLVTTMGVSFQPAMAAGTIYIRADGSVEPSSAPISNVGNVYYTFTDNILDPIVVERDNIIIDGANKSLTCSISSNGITLNGRNNITLRNTIVAEAYRGIYLINSSNVTITNNILHNNYLEGISFDYSSDNKIESNIISSNSDTWGIYLRSSSNNNISANNITNHQSGIIIANCEETILYDNFLNNPRCLTIWSSNDTLIENCTIQYRYTGIEIYNSILVMLRDNDIWCTQPGQLWSRNSLSISGDDLPHFYHDIDTSNFVNGKPVYYVIGQSGLVFDGNTMDIGYLGLISCSDVTVKNLDISGNGQGVLLTNVSNCIVEDSYFERNVDAVQVFASKNVEIRNSTFNSNNAGISTRNLWIPNLNNSNLRVEECSFYDCIEGIAGSYSDNIWLKDCIFSYCGGSVLLRYINNVEVTGCSVLHSTKYGDGWSREPTQSLDVWGSDRVIIDSCDVIGNQPIGIQFSYVTESLIRNCQVKSNAGGIYVESNNRDCIVLVENCTVTENNLNGIDVSGATGTLKENVVTGNIGGIVLDRCVDMVLENNSMSGNQYNLEVKGTTTVDLSYYTHSIDTTNTVDGKPVYYIVGEENFEVASEAGYIGLISCDNATVKDFTIKNNGQGLLLANSSNCLIQGNTFADNKIGINLYSSGANKMLANNVKDNQDGIYLESYSSSNIVSGNTVQNNVGAGIRIYYYSSHNNMSGNQIQNNDNGVTIEMAAYFNSFSENNITNNQNGIYLSSASNNTISGNKILNNQNGIYLVGSSGNNISENTIGNTVVGNQNGFFFRSSNNNNVFSNNVMGNYYGCYFHSYESVDNVFWHNSFLSNTFHVYFASLGSLNWWDNGYPSGGNYWSGYAGVDVYSGLYQNVTGSDGVGDTPYGVNEYNSDRYPLMHEDWWKDSILSYSLSPNPVLVGKMVVLQGNLSDRFGQLLSNAQVDLFVNGGFAESLFTNSSGWFSASAPVNSPGVFNVNVTFAGNATYHPSSHTQTLTVASTLDTKVSFTLSPNPITVGQTVTLKGNLTDIGSNLIGFAPLELWVKIGSGDWNYVAALSSNSTGWYQASGVVTSVGTYEVAVVYRGSSQYYLSYRIETLVVNP